MAGPRTGIRSLQEFDGRGAEPVRPGHREFAMGRAISRRVVRWATDERRKQRLLFVAMLVEPSGDTVLQFGVVHGISRSYHITSSACRMK